MLYFLVAPPRTFTIVSGTAIDEPDGPEERVGPIRVVTNRAENGQFGGGGFQKWFRSTS